MPAKKTKWIISAAIILTISGIVFFSSEWNRAGFGSMGYISEGSKFGIGIGTELDTAHKQLKSRHIYEWDLANQPEHRQNCHGKEYPGDILLKAFHDDSWRKGVICIASQNGKIIAMSWHYGMFSL